MKKLGNTTISSMGTWKVRIVSVDLEHQTVEASWNSNPVRKFYHRTWSKWRAKEPVLVGNLVKRIATRAELKKMEESKSTKP